MQGSTVSQKAQSPSVKTPGLLTDEQRWQQFHTLTSKVDRYHFWHVVRNEHIFRRLRKVRPDFASQSYLEIGCGSGNVLGYFLERGLSDCSGWDVDMHALNIARSRFPSANFEQVDMFNQRQHVRDHFGVIGSFDCLEHIEDDALCLSHIRRLLKKDGTLIVSVPAMQQLWSPFDELFGHYRRYTRQSIVSLFESCGFKDIRAQYIMAPLVPPLLLFRNNEPDMTLAQREKKYLNELQPRNRLINDLGKIVLRAERLLMGSYDLGFGASLLCSATRRD
jgi:SAM-dependent methyltransferase